MSGANYLTEAIAKGLILGPSVAAVAVDESTERRIAELTQRVREGRIARVLHFFRVA